MKVLQVPFCFHPDPVGGTEVYVEALSKKLKEQGIKTLIASPGNQDTRYVHDGLAVYRFALSPEVEDLRDLYGEGDHQAARGFGRILDCEKPDFVHLHAFTRGVSLRLLREAKQRKIPVFFTYHTPTVSCQRGTLMRWGREVCEGKLDLDLCTQCTLQGLGLGRGAANLVSRVPVSWGNFLAKTRRSGGIWTALRMREMVQTRHETFRHFLSELDHIVAVCEWVREVLLINGVPPEKITLSRQGVNLNGKMGCASGVGEEEKPRELRLVFLGRMDPTKGIHILIQALRMTPSLSVTLDLYGTVQGEGGRSYREKLKGLAANDRRIRFYPSLPVDSVPEILRQHDMVAIPSQWLETGPLIALEAFAAGKPVLGSRLGGIAEVVQDGVNGLLVEPNSCEAWNRELQRLREEKGLLFKLRSGVRPPKPMEVVAKEMEALYRRYLSFDSKTVT